MFVILEINWEKVGGKMKYFCKVGRKKKLMGMDIVVFFLYYD